MAPAMCLIVAHIMCLIVVPTMCLMVVHSMYLIAVATNASCKTVWAFLLVVWKWIIDRFTIAMTRKQKIEKLATELQRGMSILHFPCIKDSQSFHSFTIPFQYKV